jgi:hypothetical protein
MESAPKAFEAVPYKSTKNYLLFTFSVSKCTLNRMLTFDVSTPSQNIAERCIHRFQRRRFVKRPNLCQGFDY